jgi:hypothetical protein
MGGASEHPEQQEREHLYMRGTTKYPHIPAFAYRRLEELKDEGGFREISDAELHIKGKARSRRIHTMPQDSPQHGSIRERRGPGDGAQACHTGSRRSSPP